MFPIRDTVPSGTVPYVNYGIIAVCAVVFLAQVRSGDDGNTVVERYGMIPVRVWNPNERVETTERVAVRTVVGVRVLERKREVAPPGVPTWLTPLTCIFLHGGWMHFLGNVWFLYIFGDNVEDRLGHWGYLAFYLGTGLAASIAHLALNADSVVPTIGASGAIAGVMGAYYRLYPRAEVVTVIPIFVFLYFMVLPAPVFLGIWFAIQLFQGVMSVSSVASTGVAWWAHIGGFAAGFCLIVALGRAHWLRPQPIARPVRDNYYMHR